MDDHRDAADRDTEADRDAAAVWDEHYASRERIWSGRPNATLVGEIAGIEPGTALDLGCGEGGDAIWLAQQGWRVTAVDVSATALVRGRAHALESGVADSIEWERHDLTRTIPSGAFDLVSAQFLHSWEGPPRDPILRSAASVVAPGGLLLIVSHAAPPPWAAEHHHHHEGMETPEETLASLRLDPDGWTVETVGLVERVATGPDGREATLSDGIVRVRRR